jgi:nucleoside-diphosphate-sugar epimerase
MKILITGGAGFLGMHLASYFEIKGHQLTLADIHDFDKKEYPGNYKLALLDIRDPKFNNLIRGQDVIIHAAAALPLQSKEEILSVNITGTKNVLSAAKKYGVKRIIYISSTAVYGVPKRHPIYENDPLVGVGPYGHSKIESERLCQEAIKKGQNITIIRPKTFIGTGRLGVFEILFDWVHDGKRIPVIGNGKNRYQLLDVDDLVEAVYLFTQNNKEAYNDYFNIGAREYQTVEEDLNELFQFAKSGSTIFHTPAWPIKKALWFFEKLKVSPLYQWVYDTADKDSFVSIDKICKTLKWKPKYSNGQAFIKAFKWYQKHYREIKSKSPGLTHTVGWNQGILGFFKKFL